MSVTWGTRTASITTTKLIRRTRVRSSTRAARAAWMSMSSTGGPMPPGTWIWTSSLAANFSATIT